MGWRGRREGGSGWGTHVNPWLIHVNIWQKPLQYCKVISLQLIKIIGRKKKKRHRSLASDLRLEEAAMAHSPESLGLVPRDMPRLF